MHSKAAGEACNSDVQVQSLAPANLSRHLPSASNAGVLGNAVASMACTSSMSILIDSWPAGLRRMSSSLTSLAIFTSSTCSLPFLENLFFTPFAFLDFDDFACFFGILDAKEGAFVRSGP